MRFATVFKIVIFTTISVFVLSVSQAQENFAGDYINSYLVEATLLESGKVEVHETIKYHFSYPGHGIIRKINLVRINQNGDQFKVKIENIRVIGEEGSAMPFTLTGLFDYVSLKIGDPNKKVSNAVTYNIFYTMSGGLSYFDDYDEIYFQAVGTEWDVPIKSARVLLKFPSHEIIEYGCFYGAVNNNDTCVEIPGNELSTKSFYIIEALSPGEGITVFGTFPKGLVGIIEPSPYVPLVLYIIAALLIFGIIGLFVSVYVIFLWWKAKEVENRAQVVAAWFEPPKDADGTELTPAETSFLGTKRVHADDLSANILSLAQRGFLKIISDKSLSILINDIPSISIREIDRFVLDQLKAGAGKDMVLTIDVDKFNKHLFTLHSEFEGKVKGLLHSAGYFQDSPVKIGFQYMLLGIISLLLGNVVLSIVSFLFGRNSYRLTLDKGVDAVGKAKSLYNFLKSQEDYLNFQGSKKLLFEKLLPYATAFGVEKQWVNNFKELTQVESDWYQSKDRSVLSFSSLGHSLTRSITTSAYYSVGTSSKGFSSGRSSGSVGGRGSFGGGGGSRW